MEKRKRKRNEEIRKDGRNEWKEGREWMEEGRNAEIRMKWRRRTWSERNRCHVTVSARKMGSKKGKYEHLKELENTP